MLIFSRKMLDEKFRCLLINLTFRCFPLFEKLNPSQPLFVYIPPRNCSTHTPQEKLWCSQRKKPGRNINKLNLMLSLSLFIEWSAFI